MNFRNLKYLNYCQRWIIIVFFVCLTFQSNVQAISEDSFEESFGDAVFVSIATGRAQNIVNAPAVASVITAAEIKEMGAFSLEQVLQVIPGIHMSVSPGSYLPIYQFRGISSAFNPHVLLLVNGIPMTNVFVGNRGQVWSGMPVESIERIEVIRGPGSAVHGADAFAGVINVVTKGANNIAGTDFGLRTGSFGTKDGWVRHTGQLGAVNVFASLEFHKTDGQKEIITEDSQTQFDTLFTSNASLAPGPVNTRAEWLDARVEFSFKNWLIRAGFQGRRDIGTGAGVAQALDPVGKGDSERINLDLTYEKPNIGKNWDAKIRFSYLDVSTRTELVIFPPGALGGAFPNGILGNPDVNERHMRIQGDAFYTQFRDHTLRIGSGMHLADMYKIEESKNFNVNNSPKADLTDVSDTPEVFIPEKDRQVYYAYLQDEWAIATDLILTAGLRYDHY